MTRRTRIFGGLVLATLGAGTLVGCIASRTTDATEVGYRGEDGSADGRVSVRTVRPRLDPTFRITNEQIAVVRPFYEAALRTRASGVVRTVPKEIGEEVRAGEVLVEIDAPDLDADVIQREAVIAQRQQELRVSQAMLRFAEAAVESARTMVAQRTAEARQSAATRDYKASYLARVRGLLAERAVPAELVDEHQRDYLAAEAAAEAAQVAIQRARADLLEKEASLEAAQTDIDLKTALVRVAEKDRDRAMAAASFARVNAPFDGVIIKRSADPGVFVQNATTSATEPLIILARTDLVTVVTKLPDVAAAYISRDTEVEVTFLDRPDLRVKGRVTRYAPAIDGMDRTIRVEVDVFNGPRVEYEQALARMFAGAAAPFAPPNGVSAAAAVLAGEPHRRMFYKGTRDGMAVCPDIPTGGRTHPILPGMTATMKVYLDRVSAAFLLPASAVYGRGGKTYVLLVEDGVTKQVPVRVQVSDGRLAKVALLPAPGVVQEFTGSEEVVLSRQLEVGDGAKVKTVLGDW